MAGANVKQPVSGCQVLDRTAPLPKQNAPHCCPHIPAAACSGLLCVTGSCLPTVQRKAGTPSSPEPAPACSHELLCTRHAPLLRTAPAPGKHLAPTNKRPTGVCYTLGSGPVVQAASLQNSQERDHQILQSHVLIAQTTRKTYAQLTHSQHSGRSEAVTCAIVISSLTETEQLWQGAASRNVGGCKRQRPRVHSPAQVLKWRSCQMGLLCPEARPDAASDLSALRGMPSLPRSACMRVSVHLQSSCPADKRCNHSFIHSSLELLVPSLTLLPLNSSDCILYSGMPLT